MVSGTTYIQVTAPISSGSSGGALISEKGELIGITAATVNNGQNLNLAVPISALASLKRTGYRSISAVVEEYFRKLSSDFTVSKTAVTLNSDESAVITCSVPDIPSGYALSYEVSESGIVQCAWGSWRENDSVELTLTGKDSGSVTVTLKLHDRRENILAERTLQVTVR